MLIGLIFFAGTLMIAQVIPLREASSAVLAHKRTITIVYVLLMFLEISSLHESDATMTNKWPLARVRSQMIVELARTLHYPMTTIVEFTLE